MLLVIHNVYIVAILSYRFTIKYLFLFAFLGMGVSGSQDSDVSRISTKEWVRFLNQKLLLFSLS